MIAFNAAYSGFPCGFDGFVSVPEIAQHPQALIIRIYVLMNNHDDILLYA